MLARFVVALSVLWSSTALADKADPPPGPYRGVTASIDGRFVAKWTIDAVSISTDGGKSFAPALDHPGEVSAAALDARGTLYVVRGTSVGVQSGTSERWSTVPGVISISDMIVAGPNVVLQALVAAVGDDDPAERIVVSRDAGRSWTARPEWQVGNFQTTVALADDGTIDYISGWEAACGGGYQSRFHGSIASETLSDGRWSMDAPTTATPTLSGVAYALDESCVPGQTALCADTTRGVVAVRLDHPYAVPAGTYQLFSRALGKRSIVLMGSALVMLDGTRGRVLATNAPAQVSSFSGTAQGEAWVIADGQVRHFTGAAWVR